MKFCILGGGGYIGQLLARKLIKSDHDVTILDLAFTHIPYISFDWSQVRCVNGSILDEAKLKEAIKDCDACFHLAAYGMSGGASLDKKMTHLVNVEGTKMVIDACLEANCKRLVYTSTVTVSFGPDEVDDLTEDAPYLESFLTPYAESKCIAEQLILSAAKEGKLQTCALRLRGVFGPGEIRTTEKTFNLCAKGLIFATFEKSNPCLSQYSGAENVIQALIKAEESLANNPGSPANGNAYNIVDDGKVSNFEFWFPLILLLGLKLPKFKAPYLLVYYFAFFMEILWHLFKIEPLMTRLEINIVALNNTYSIEKAKRDFGYEPINNHCLKSTIEYYANSGKTTSTKVNHWKIEKSYLNALFFVFCGIVYCFVWPYIGIFKAQTIGI